MDKYARAIRDDMNQLAEEARGLLNATSDLAGDGMAAARQRLTTSIERGKALCDRIRERTVEGVEATDDAVRTHPYQAITLGIGLGAALGCLAAVGYCRLRN